MRAPAIQPLATAIGLDILKRGGNAADAAVAVAAALNGELGGRCCCGQLAERLTGSDGAVLHGHWRRLLCSLLQCCRKDGTSHAFPRTGLALTAAAQVEALNGSGRAPAGLTLERAAADCPGAAALPPFHAHTVTVPGAAAGWAGAVCVLMALGLVKR